MWTKEQIESAYAIVAGDGKANSGTLVQVALHSMGVRVDIADLIASAAQVALEGLEPEEPEMTVPAQPQAVATPEREIPEDAAEVSKPEFPRAENDGYGRLYRVDHGPDMPGRFLNYFLQDARILILSEDGTKPSSEFTGAYQFGPIGWDALNRAMEEELSYGRTREYPEDGPGAWIDALADL